jgi:hypothetical protein
LREPPTRASLNTRVVSIAPNSGPSRNREPHNVIEMLRTNDLVLISLVEAILTSERVGYFVADNHMSALEGAIGMLPRRVLVDAEHASRARRLLIAAGLGSELRPDAPRGA